MKNRPRPCNFTHVPACRLMTCFHNLLLFGPDHDSNRYMQETGRAEGITFDYGCVRRVPGRSLGGVQEHPLCMRACVHVCICVSVRVCASAACFVATRRPISGMIANTLDSY